MSLSAFGAFTLALGALCFIGPFGWAIVAIVLLSLFRTAAAFNLTSIGGLSILCANVFLLFYLVRAFCRTGPVLFVQAFVPPSPGFWLLIMSLYAVVSAVFFPRLMAGMTETISITRTSDGLTSLQLRPLQSNMMYVTQLVYFLGGVAAFMATFALARLPGGFRALRLAIFLLLGLHVVVAVMDLVTHVTGTAFLMDFMRTANYALLTDVEKAGLKRITGSFSEASAFACFTIVTFAICCSLWLDGERSRLTGFLSAAMLALLLASTSGTAYVGLGVLLTLLVFYEAFGPLVGRPIRRPIALVALAGVALAVLLSLIVLAPTFATGIQTFFEETIFGKLSDASGRERMMWNEVAFRNFLDSGGFGVGIGGARASSYLLVLLSNLGWPGLLLFCAFVSSLLWRPLLSSLTKEEVRLVTALRCGIVGTIIAEGIVGAVFDIGLLFYVLAGGVAASLAQTQTRARPSFPVMLPTNAPFAYPRFGFKRLQTGDGR